MNLRRVVLRSFPAPMMAVAFALLTSEPVFAQSIDQNLWVTNGSVRAVVEAGGTIYIGGTFTQVGPATGCAVPLDSTTGLPLGVPKVAGEVHAVALDGSGGWYVGGSFTHVGGIPRSNIAHILADHSLSAWNPGANGEVYALAVSGGTVYAGGAFNSAGGQTRGRIAALDGTTGLATAWNPNADSYVYALVVSGSTVYAGGRFNFVGAQERRAIAALDASTGLATAWDPQGNSHVYALAVSGATVYAGGFFTSIGGQARNYIAALDASSGLATAWNPDPNQFVSALAVSGSTVYAGGIFVTIGEQTRNGIAALDATTGLATAWDPNADDGVRALAVSGGTVYAGGFFSSIGGQMRNNIAALDAASGLATAWDPNAGEYVLALAVNGGIVYAGGGFSTVGGQPRNNIAALDRASGLATAWNPNANSAVQSLAVSGGTVYAGGGFTSIGGQTRSKIAALDAGTGLATAWDPNANSSVAALVVSGGTVYVGGTFQSIGGETRNFIAELDRASGLATAWDPNALGAVRALAVGGGTVYAGGLFTSIGAEARNRIAALDGASGLATAWDPDASSVVEALAVGGGTVYAAGDFTTIGGQTRNRIAALNGASGLATPWDPNASDPVHALVVSGGTVYAGGDFTSIGGQARNKVAALNGASGLATAWDPNAFGHVSEPGAFVHAYALAVSGGTVYAGGDFTAIGGRPQAGIAAIGALMVTAVQPASGGNAGVVTATVTGLSLLTGAAVRLTRGGQPDIAGTAVAVAADGLGLTANFDLAGATTGLWDVVVTNPDLQTATLPNGFTIEAIEAPQLRIDLVGRDSIRANFPTAFDLVINNQGNVDALGVPLWITGIPLDATVDLGFPLIYPDQDAGEPDWSQDSLSFTSPTGRYLALVIPRIPPGSISRRINLTVPISVSSFQLRAALTPPWADGTVFRACLTGGGVIQNGLCMGAQLTAINDSALTSATGTELLSGIGVWSKIAWQCEGATSLTVAQDEARQALGYLKQPVEQGTAAAGCADLLLPRWQDVLGVLVVNSLDPNDKLGARKRLSIGQDVPYTIQFENLSTAIAARTVRVADNLDLSRLDPGTIGLGAITIGTVISIPSDPRASSFAPPDIPLRPGMSVRVRVTIDHDFGLMTWDFTSIDPATGQAPSDPLAGFLPPNLLPPAGQGSVQFTVKPLATLASGDSIHNVAAITFDGSTIYTAPWSSTVDNTAPQSSVHLLSANQDSARFTVIWEAIGSPDLKDFNIYVSQDGGTMREWRRMTIATADTFHAAAGSSYRFYSQARDTIGNDEAPHTGPNAETTVANPALGIGGPGSLRLALEGAIPNPAVADLRVVFTLPVRDAATLELIDIAGRRVLRREVGALGPGRHTLTLSASHRLRPGLYFLRLTQRGQALTSRVALVR